MHLGCGTQKTTFRRSSYTFVLGLYMDGLSHQFLLVEQLDKFIKTNSKIKMNNYGNKIIHQYRAKP